MMYLKLAFRNAKRSVRDYLLYMFTMIMLISILCVSNHIAVFGRMQAGFQTAALPILIVLIMAVLMSYINNFMIKQRAKEFATYLLLGMEKKKLSLLFTLEICVIGVICLLFGILAGTVVMRNEVTEHFGLMIKSVMQTVLYFCMIEIVSAICMHRKWNSMEISELLKEEKRNQRLAETGKTLWGVIFISSMMLVLALLCVIVFFSSGAVRLAISLISLPVLLGILSFYKWLFAYLASKRLHKSESLYQGLAIYRIGETTTNMKTSAVINSVFGICLLCSASAFMCGVLFLNKNLDILSPKDQQWMGFLQICQCIIFTVIYFSILSLLQIMEWKRQTKRLKILYYMGKNQAELNTLIKTQILVKLLMPAWVCFALLIIAVPLINLRLNEWLPATMHNEIIKAAGLFAACFAILCLCYFILVYFYSKKIYNECRFAINQM